METKTCISCGKKCSDKNRLIAIDYQVFNLCDTCKKKYDDLIEQVSTMFPPKAMIHVTLNKFSGFKGISEAELVRLLEIKNRSRWDRDKLLEKFFNFNKKIKEEFGSFYLFREYFEKYI